LSGAPRPVTVEDLVTLNRRAVLYGGGTSGVRDSARLEYAVDRPFLVFDDRPLYPTHHAKAAALMEIVIKDHAFVDGNKRTGQRAGLFTGSSIKKSSIARARYGGAWCTGVPDKYHRGAQQGSSSASRPLSLHFPY
jgi:hypothetical protein